VVAAVVHPWPAPRPPDEVLHLSTGWAGRSAGASRYFRAGGNRLTGDTHPLGGDRARSQRGTAPSDLRISRRWQGPRASALLGRAPRPPAPGGRPRSGAQLRTATRRDVAPSPGGDGTARQEAVSRSAPCCHSIDSMVRASSGEWRLFPYPNRFARALGDTHLNATITRSVARKV